MGSRWRVTVRCWMRSGRCWRRRARWRGAGWWGSPSLVSARGRPSLRGGALLVALLVALTRALAAAPANADGAAASADAPLVLGVRFDGSRAIPDRELRKQIDTKPRPWLQLWKPRPTLSEETVTADAQRLQGFYQTRGYFEARVQAETQPDPARRGAVAVFRIDEGAPV